MRAVFSSILAVLAFAGASFGGGASARPLTPAEERYIPWHSQMPRCDADAVLKRIRSRFLDRESGYWKSGLEIDYFTKVRETGYRATGVDYIPRRYCSALAHVNDRKTRVVHYWIGEDMTMTGSDAVRSVGQSLTLGLLPRFDPSPFDWWGVEWCVVGLDRNYAYARNCQAARP